ncbi:MAG TPA: N(4)-(beta-N-acetylglucosaminyl)-L-asparaginase [bacterium]|nr:N(4)-(beta-N-acetylglucosaminyl)-L-asparaginase [bacterium]
MSLPTPGSLTRRQFIGTAAAAGALAATGAGRAQEATDEGPVAVASANGRDAVVRAREAMLQGGRPVDAAVSGVNLVELDPEDTSVGFGGLPNEDGVVQLDAAVMDGPGHNAGGVAALEGVKMPSRVALLVMRRTDHCLLVGEGARRFASAHGFAHEELLTDRARRIWLHWKEGLSREDDWLPPQAEDVEAERGPKGRPTGTIHLSARDAQGDLGAATTTSGLAFKIPGRVGDSPLIGNGLYVDNEVGSAGSTGRGESVILSCGSFAIVERMRAGRDPQQACLDILERIAGQSRRNGLVDSQGRPTFNVRFYALAKDGRHAGASLYSGGQYAVADAAGARLERCAYLFER